MFTFTPLDGAQVGYSMGTNVNTPFFKYPRQKTTICHFFHNLLSLLPSQTLRFSHGGERETRVIREWLVTKRKARFLLPAFLCAQEEALTKVIMALMSVYVSRANFTTKACL